jgi:ribosomal protein S18 acetylase RimI-like enzyme
MAHLPAVGTRVSLRYRRPAGSVPPLTDVIGHLLQTDPVVRVRAKTGEVVDIAADDIVTVRALTDVPVRTSQIRAMEHAAALAWPGTEHEWINGWLVRGADGYTHRANSAVPLAIEANVAGVPAVVDWYVRRGRTPWLAVPDRLLPLRNPVPAHLETVVMVRDLPAGEPVAAATFASRPDATWLRVYERDVPVDVLSAVVDGVVVFGRRGDAAVGRAAVTSAPDGTRWAGLSAVRVAEDHRRDGQARALCSALLDWATGQGARHCYAQVLVDNAAAIALYEQLGFTKQHRSHYIDGTSL